MKTNRRTIKLAMSGLLAAIVCLGVSTGAVRATVFHQFEASVRTSTGLVNPAVLVGFNPQPEPPAHPPEPVLTDPTMPKLNWANDTNHYQIVFGFDLGSDVSFNPQPEPPAVDGQFDFSITSPGTSPDTFDIVLTLTTNGTLDRASWVMFNPQPEPPAFGGKTLGFEFDVTPHSPTDVTLAWGLTDHQTGEMAIFSLVPEPASLTLLLLGVVGLALRRAM